MKRLEWNSTEFMWTWRIFAGNVRTSAYIPFNPDTIPAGVTPEQFAEAVEQVREDDNEPF